jgi:hypothetical protein
MIPENECAWPLAGQLFPARIAGKVARQIVSQIVTSLACRGLRFVNPSTLKSAVTLTVVVRAASGTPTGTVTFKKNGTVLGS